MTTLQSFPPEICSLICQDPILERLDLTSICFISPAFRNEAQRELSNHFPFLRGLSRVRAWCLSLQSRPHLAINTKGLVLLLPQQSSFLAFDTIWNLNDALQACVNLKELAVLHEECHPFRPEFNPFPLNLLSFCHILLSDKQFKLTKFVNGYYHQNHTSFSKFLAYQPNLESLELHSGKTHVSKGTLPLRYLKTLGCPPQFLDSSYSITRLRLDFENSTDVCEIDVLGSVLSRNLTKKMKSLAIFLNQGQSHFPEILRVIAVSHIYIQHLEIHQFLPIQIEKELPLPVNSYGRNIRTLVFRPPPGLPKKAGDNPNLCAYVELRTPIGRRKVAEKLILRTLPSLTRLVLVVHGNNYEFRRNLFTGVITGENLITRNTREWSLVN